MAWVWAERLRCADAFSLFELLVVLVIIGLAASLVVPRLGGGLDKIRLRTAANDIMAILRYARNQAISRGKNQSVVLETTHRILFILPDSLDADGGGSAVPTVSSLKEKLEHYQLPDGVEIQIDEHPFEKDDSRVVLASFFPMGNSTGGSIRLTDAMDRMRRIDIDLITGSVTLNE